MPNITMKKKELIDLNNALYKVGNLTGPRFTYVIARNMSLLKDEMASLDKAFRADDGYIEYDKERAALAQEYSEKDPTTNKPKTLMENGVERYVMADQKKFDDALKVVQEKHKDAIDRRKDQVELFNKLLEEDTTVMLYELKQEDLPANITVDQLSGLTRILANADNQ